MIIVGYACPSLGNGRPLSLSKKGFSPLLCQVSTDLDEIWQRSVVAQIHLSVQFHPDLCIGGSRSNDQGLEFITAPVVYNGSPRCRWQTHKCLGSGRCCYETFRKFLTWAEPEQIMAGFPVSCAQPAGKRFPANQ